MDVTNEVADDSDDDGAQLVAQLREAFRPHLAEVFRQLTKFDGLMEPLRAFRTQCTNAGLDGSVAAHFLRLYAEYIELGLEMPRVEAQLLALFEPDRVPDHADSATRGAMLRAAGKRREDGKPTCGRASDASRALRKRIHELKDGVDAADAAFANTVRSVVARLTEMRDAEVYDEQALVELEKRGEKLRKLSDGEPLLPFPLPTD